jgi:hypothetical protein
MQTRSTLKTLIHHPEPSPFKANDAFFTPRKRRASEDSTDFKDSSTVGSPADYDSDDFDRSEIKRRKRKSASQVKILKQEYNANPNWSKDTYAELAAKTALTESQVYKWSWDYRKKLRHRQAAVPSGFLVCTEVLAPTPFDSAVYGLQRAYRTAWRSYTGGCLSATTPSRFLAVS